MKYIFFLLLLTTLSISKSYAQDNLPLVYEIKTDTTPSQTLGNSYWQMLEDPESKWTIDEVSHPPIAGKFHVNTTKINRALTVDYSINTCWFRYRFKNSMAHEARITLPKNVTYCDIYTSSSEGKGNHKTTGTGVPWSKRDDLKRITTLTFTMQPGEELLVYERDSADYNYQGYNSFEIKFGFTDRVVQDYYDKNDSSILPSFIFGIFLLAALFNLYFFLIVHQRVYLLFSLMLFCRGISRFLWANDVFFRETPEAKMIIGYVFSTLFFVFLIHFLRYFLETFKRFPRWDKFLTYLSIYLCLINIWPVYNSIFPVGYDDLVGPSIMILSILITFILFLRARVKTVWFPILATLPLTFIMCIPSVAHIWRWRWAVDNFDLLEQIGLLWLLIFFSLNLFQRYQQLQIKIGEEKLARERLAKEKEVERSLLIAQQKVQLEKDVEERTAELTQSLKDLKATQAQLIQSEKMASLGELTAGIAHEIQNPLNFVNNFSDVNKELVDEMQHEMDKGNMADAKAISNEIKENEEKINHHGKRADVIVKGMLQHSRSSSGQKEPSDINLLADEYLRLAYHGLRAKDKSFNATMHTDFDDAIGKISVVPQEFGRVLLNLINNAFYAVAEKKKSILHNAEAIEYEPTVSLVTKKIGDKVEIAVRDNGMGIPDKIRGKIFQPFFTTKPTGQGTGLGLSLAYDIIKAHEGEIKTISKAGEGAEFCIVLPG